MKRVLNSCTIKLPYVNGIEQDFFKYQNDLSLEEYIPFFVTSRLDQMEFTFEIKAPLLTFLAFQDANLGTLTRLDIPEHPIAYLPPQFYTKDASGYTSMDGKSSNIYTTKLFNFYTAAFNFYNNLLREGLCKEEANLVLPQGVFITFLWKINAKDLIKYIEEHYSDSPETYGYCSTFVLYLEEHLPKVTKWLKVNRWQSINL